MTIILAVDEPMTQAQVADVLRERWDELWKLSPAERRVRIDEILHGQRDRSNVR